MIQETNLTGQVALVTGGGRGLGRAIALRLAAAGAHVAIAARSADQLAETVAQVQAAGGHAQAFVTDVTDQHAVEVMAQAIERGLGPVSLLVNNAGIAGPAGPLWENDPLEWWRCVEINLRGTFLCCQAVAPSMVARRQGRIVNMVSEAGTMAIPFLSAYVVGKTGLIRLTEVLAQELQPHGVSVFAVIPGTVRTAFTEEALSSSDAQQWLPWFGEIFAAGLDVPPELVAGLIHALASGEADGLTGQVVSVTDDLGQRIDQVVKN